MSPRDWRLRIDDILSAIDKIGRYTSDMSGESLAADEKTLDAVLFDVAVIGEAARNVPEDVVARSPQIPWAAMRDMRNIVVHEYFGLDLDRIWSTATTSLQSLREEIERLLSTTD